jgi:hypothetical protein
MNSFLKKFGSVALQVGKIAGRVSGVLNTPIVQGLEQQFLPADIAGKVIAVENELVQFTDVIQDIEVIGQALTLPGTEKLKAATPLITQVVLQSDLLLKHKIHDQALFSKAMEGYAQATADLLNSLDESGVQTADKAA